MNTVTHSQSRIKRFFTENRVVKVLRLFREAFAGYKKQIVTLIALGFLGGIFESVGVTAIIPLFSFLSDDSGASSNIVTKTARHVFEFLHIPFSITHVLVFIALVFILKAIAMFFSRYITDVIRASYIRDMRIRLFKQSIDASWPYLSQQRIGYLEKILSNDIDVGASILMYLTSTTILLINTALYIFIAFNISILITLVTLAVGGIIFLILKPLIYQTKVVAQRSEQVMKDGSHHINESLIGIKTIKSTPGQEQIINKINGIFEEWRELRIKLATYANVVTVSVQPIAVLLILGLFALSYNMGFFAFASFAVIIYAINRIFAYIQNAQTQLHNINASYPFLETALRYKKEIEQNKEERTGTEDFIFNNSLSFNDVFFSYEKEQRTLSSINLEVQKGQTIGIIGPSGSGKTTFVDLLLRLITPQQGSISLDGVSINEIDKARWKESVGYVSQDIFLFNDSIRNNIRFYSDNVSDADIERAIKMANIDTFIQSLDKGLDTIVGERGTRLSGGERQRVVLARVLARSPQLLVLDEATSALDNESQALIQETIEGLHGEVTIILIAHRPSTVRNADKLLVFKEGKIVEKGTPEEMLENKGSYYYKVAHKYTK